MTVKTALALKLALMSALGTAPLLLALALVSTLGTGPDTGTSAVTRQLVIGV
jgi:hypothetical protein